MKRLISPDRRKKKDFSDTVICITHAKNPEDTEFIKAELINRYNPRDVLIFPIGPTIGTYSGEDGIVITF